MKDEKTNTEELVQVVNKQLVTSSITVARNFEKRHDHVMRDIEVYKKAVKPCPKIRRRKNQQRKNRNRK